MRSLGRSARKAVICPDAPGNSRKSNTSCAPGTASANVSPRWISTPATRTSGSLGVNPFDRIASGICSMLTLFEDANCTVVIPSLRLTVAEVTPSIFSMATRTGVGANRSVHAEDGLSHLQQLTARGHGLTKAVRQIASTNRCIMSSCIERVLPKVRPSQSRQLYSGFRRDRPACGARVNSKGKKMRLREAPNDCAESAARPACPATTTERADAWRRGGRLGAPAIRLPTADCR